MQLIPRNISALIRRFCGVLSLFIPMMSAHAEVILQAFDMSWNDVAKNIEVWKKDGYSFIQVSPPQKSNPCSEWYCKYQPLDHTKIEGPLGSEVEFRNMILKAHSVGVKILVDFVFNQMTNYGSYAKTLAFPRFSVADFHERIAIRPDGSNNWNGWLNGDLPDLRTESQYVRQEAKNYVNKLLALGADGFRFDAVKHIEPEFFTAILKDVGSNIYYYGEVLDTRIDNLNYYTQTMDITDFKLVETMVQAFGWGGNLEALVAPADTGRALAGNAAITFARNHDTAMSPLYYGGLVFSDQRDIALANAFVLARLDGLPMIYRDDAADPIALAGIKFHKSMLGKTDFSYAVNSNTLIIDRGDSGMAIINKSTNWTELADFKTPRLSEGCYRELHYNFVARVARGQDGHKRFAFWAKAGETGPRIGPRDALFLVRTDASACPR